VEDIPDELIKTEIKIELLRRAFSSVPNGSAKSPGIAAKMLKRAARNNVL
jgi:hypothetical protein